MSIDQYNNQGMYSTEFLPKIVKVLDIIMYVFNLFQNCLFASSLQQQSVPNYEYNSNSPDGGSYDGSYPDGSDYIPNSPLSGLYDDSQPITAEENGCHRTPYKESYDDYSTESGGLEMKAVYIIFLEFLFEVYFHNQKLSVVMRRLFTQLFIWLNCTEYSLYLLNLLLPYVNRLYKMVIVDLSDTAK